MSDEGSRNRFLPQPISTHWLVGGGEMGDRIRAFDWSKTEIGPPETWSAALRMMVSFMLANRFPLLLWWGPQYVSIYNDAYCPVLGAKHPWGLGRPLSECWSEIWDVLKPLVDTPFNGGPSTWNEDIELEIKRHDFLEETHFTVAYSPVPDETVPGGIGGVLATVHEITEKVIGERRVNALRDLGSSAIDAKTAEEACGAAAEGLRRHSKDIPFALLYLITPDSNEARLASVAGVVLEPGFAPAVIELGAQHQTWPLGDVARTQRMQVVQDLAGRFGKAVPRGPWSDTPYEAVILPIRSNLADQVAGFLVAGVSARLKLDNLYRSFFELLATQIATAVANARAYEEERKRAEALAEIDRAKTLFFSNVSHEFRTPLTLMLGPLQDALASADLPERERERLVVAHRNSLRLLKLVNSLLDFARIEAGRAQASFEPLDLAALTADLAGNFRSACERAGLGLIVDCPPLPDAIHVDRDMWEKIVLNLLSNAFKFTFAGEIAVRLRAVDGHAELSVSDTGVGVPENELPRLFERFHRIEGQKSRTYEGSGIGLALVQELVKLNGGTITASSRFGEGATFSVTLPFGTDHLPQKRIRPGGKFTSTSVKAEAYVDEALRWLSDSVGSDDRSSIDDVGSPLKFHKRPHVLVADDNADMRAHVRRLLERHFNVETVADGQAALDALRERRSDLVIADVMMPRLDGFGLLRAIRDDPELKDIQVIMLSARAGEESRLDGLAVGADDYLIKPFSGRELVARVESNIRLARVRAEASQELRAREEHYRQLVEQTPDGIFVANSEGRYVDVNSAGFGMLGMTREEVLACSFTDVLEPAEHHRLPSEIARFDDGSVVRSEWRMRRKDGSVFDAEIVGRRLPNGNLQGIVRDVTQNRRREEALRGSEARFRMLADNMSQLAWTCDKLGDVTWYNQRWLDYTGLSFEEMMGWGWKQVHHPDHVDRVVASVARSRESGEPWEDTFPLRGMDGNYRWFLSRAVPIRNAAGEIVRWFGTNTDITAQRKAEETQRMLTGELSHRVKNMLATVQAIASQTLRHNKDPAQFVTSFGGRIQSMSRMHSMLSNSEWQGADLRDIIRDQLFLGPIDNTRVTAWGPAVRLEPQIAPQVAMMLHELGTNSIKYGALSNAEGVVTINWAVNDDMLRLRWAERGGPPLQAPVRRGFGTKLIEQSAKSGGGGAHMSMEADGVQWEISLPLPRADAETESRSEYVDATLRLEEGSNADAPSPILAGKRFLVIEDEPLVALDIISSLEQAGVHLEGAVGCASEALSQIERTTLDAALLDANLRGEPVGDIAAALTRKNVPFIFVTGYGRENLPPAFAGATVLSKPFSQQQLLEAAVKLVQKPADVRKLRD
jgi:PAS domain S-box-containing protein